MRYRSYNNGGNFFGMGLLFFFMFGGFKTVFLLLPLFLYFLPIILAVYFGLKLLRAITGNMRLNKNTKNQSQDKTHFVELLVHLIVNAIRADGVIDPKELQVVQHFFQHRLHFKPIQLQWVQDLVNYALQQEYNAIEVSYEINKQFGTDEKHLTMELLFEIIAADNKITTEEINFIDNVAELLHINSVFYQQLKQKFINHSANAQDSDYDVLGVKQNASQPEIKKAYKALCKKFHPDRVQHLGDEFKEFADEKIKAINTAYDNLSKVKA